MQQDEVVMEALGWIFGSDVASFSPADFVKAIRTRWLPVQSATAQFSMLEDGLD